MAELDDQGDQSRILRASKEGDDAIREARQLPIQGVIRYTLPSYRSSRGAGCYVQAYDALNAMLEGRAPVSLKRAVFLVENAYYENALSYEAYDSHLRNIVAFCRARMQQEHIKGGDNAALNDLLFRFMSDTLSVIDPATGTKVTHFPDHYDFDDFYGTADWTKLFVTKLMNTNFGQCHSMPLLYGILAEELGAKAYLSASPSHLFIKYRKSSRKCRSGTE